MALNNNFSQLQTAKLITKGQTSKELSKCIIADPVIGALGEGETKCDILSA